MEVLTLRMGSFQITLLQNSGNRLVASFRKAGTDAEYAVGELWMGNGKSYTVYLAGDDSKAKVKLYEDDLSVPPLGKVKFIHLSDGVPPDVRRKDLSGNEIINNISRNVESSYKNFDPGSLKFSLYGTASDNLIGNFEVSDLEAGRIYAVYLIGTESTNIQANIVEY